MHLTRKTLYLGDDAGPEPAPSHDFVGVWLPTTGWGGIHACVKA